MAHKNTGNFYMDAQTAEILKEVLPDAIKILGPALVTGLVAYFTAKIQYKSKLDELIGNQSFKAREHLLDYYKKRITDAGEAANALNYTLGTILGSASTISLCNDDSDETYELEDAVPNLASVDMYMESCEFEVRTMLRDMKEVNLDESEEYFKLSEYQEVARSLAPSSELSVLKRNILKLSEIYTFIARCGQLGLDARIHNLFGKFVNNTK